MSIKGADVRLTYLELEGFKSFKDKAVIGPLDDFTCIVGPNGCGKSVVGEAIAFALGGNRKMLRAGSLAGLLNQELKAAAGRTAHVTLHLDPVIAEGKESTATSTPGGNGTIASKGASKQQPQEQQTQAQQQRLSVSRTLCGNSTKTHIKRQGSTSWTAVSQAELQAELALYGIQTQVVDRYIVTQARQAVDVGSAVGLVNYLELLTGTEDYAARIDEQGKLVERLAASTDETQQHISSLESERETLAPHVAHWQQVQQLDAQLQQEQLQLLQDQLVHGIRLTQQHHQQLQESKAAAAAAAARLHTLQQQEKKLHMEQDDMMDKLQACKLSEQRHKKRVDRLSASIAAMNVELSSLTAAAKNQHEVAEKLQAKLAKLQAEEAQHKQNVADGHMQLRQLQEKKEAVEQELTAARQQVAAVSSATAAASSLAASEGSASAAISQQVEEAAIELLELQDRQGAAAVKATKAAQSVRSLYAAKEEVEWQANRTRQQLQDAIGSLPEVSAAVQAAKAALHEAEQGWKQAMLQHRLLQNELQEPHELHQQQSQRKHGQHQHQPVGRGSKWDAAVQELKQSSDAGQLPGAFYGRLRNLAYVKDPSVSRALNAALQEVCNLNSMLVVSNRSTASAVIEHMKQQKVGIATCKILAEYHTAAAAAVSSSSSGSSGNRDMQPLLHFVGAAEGVPGLQGLLQQLLGNWLLVDNREVATQLRRQLKQNLVTRSGEVYKTDGEIVVSMGSNSTGPSNHNSSNSSSPYALQVAWCAPIQPTSAAVKPSGTQQQSVTATASVANTKQQLRQLENRVAAAAQAAAAADKQLRVARDNHSTQQQRLVLADRTVQRLKSQQDLQAIKTVQELSGLEQQLHAAEQQQLAAQQAAMDAATAVQHADQKHKQLQTKLQQRLAIAAQEEYKRAAGDSSSSGSSREQSDINHELVSAQSKLKDAELQFTDASAAVTAAWARADSEKQLQRKASSRAAAVAKELSKLQGTTKQQDVHQAQARLVSLNQQLVTSQAACEAAAAQEAELSKALKPVKQQLLKASKAAIEAHVAHGAAQAELVQCKAAVQELQQRQEQLHAALQLRQRAGANADMPDINLDEDGPAQQEAKATAAEAGALPASQGPLAGAAAAATGQTIKGLADGDCEYNMDCDTEHVAMGQQAANADQHKWQKQQPQSGDQPMETDHNAEGSAMPKHSQQKAAVDKRDKRKAVIDSGSSSSDNCSRSSKQRSQLDSNTRHQAQPGHAGRKRNSTSDARQAKDQATARGKSAGATRSPAIANGRSSRRTRSGTGRVAVVKYGQDDSSAQQQKQKQLIAAQLQMEGQQLLQREQQLAGQHQELQLQRSKVNESALDRDLAALRALAAARKTLQQVEQQLDDAIAVREQLTDERYTKLSAVLQSLNAHLDSVYRQLTGGCGSAYCAYTQERRLLFSHGVTLHVQPDGNAWRRFGMLSGGQQALATLALSFALQALFPSPFYFFDEVDCALDTTAAGRVAAYVRSQCKGSHKAHAAAAALSSIKHITATHKDALPAPAGAAVAGNMQHADAYPAGQLHVEQEMEIDAEVTAAADATPDDSQQADVLADMVKLGNGPAKTKGPQRSVSSDVPNRQGRNQALGQACEVGESVAGSGACGGVSGSGAVAAAQYLLVSHKPAVFESASCLLGVYSNGRGSSAAVVAHF